MCFNILCEKYATKSLYGYCPNWALNWEYRQKGIMNEIQLYGSDILSLQEVETEYFNKVLLPQMRNFGYDGIFSPKSRAKTMSENERKHVDGCAIFFRTNKFKLLEQRLVEFNQLAMANADGCEDMLNRVMTKDNIGLAALLQVATDMPPLLVSTVHIHWDPEFSDVKLIQTMMLVYELRDIIEEAKARLHVTEIPILLCGDFNSLPSSGVIEFLTSGHISKDHPDFKQLGYSLSRMCSADNSDEYTHPFKIARSYSGDELPYTNYTYDFKGIIDYIFYSTGHLRELGVLGPVDPAWMANNKVVGCPHPHIPSDHFPLVVEMELLRSSPPPANGILRR
ncbi:CNOT6L [Cordylochernes scorpioides]|uniref:CNOT6L n=1 Tax=Cordylochernes scorpioides TaxID=51811 RepID=A0ABY6L7R8_9ARAC|nr:CNOT6L [Cordylochernes scorpioides]